MAYNSNNKYIQTRCFFPQQSTLFCSKDQAMTLILGISTSRQLERTFASCDQTCIHQLEHLRVHIT